MEVNGRQINELHNIQHINNINSILNLGILSHNRAANVTHTSIASPIIQTKRNKRIPNGSYLHDYANLYFDARNPMMYKIHVINRVTNICILRVSEEVLNLNGTIITDMNAASDYVKFLSISDIEHLNFDIIFTRDWTSPNQIEKFRRRAIKCAEVLVRDRVTPNHIIGAYVKDNASRTLLVNQGFAGQIDINSDIFFG